MVLDSHVAKPLLKIITFDSCILMEAHGILDFPGGSVIKNIPVNAGDVGLIPGLRRSPGEGNGNPLQYSCQGNLTDRRVCWATVHGIAKSRAQLSD